MPMPGVSGRSIYPPSRLWWLMNTALAGSSSPGEYSCVTKLGIEASTWIAAEVVIGPRALCVQSAEW